MADHYLLRKFISDHQDQSSCVLKATIVYARRVHSSSSLDFSLVVAEIWNPAILLTDTQIKKWRFRRLDALVFLQSSSSKRTPRAIPGSAHLTRVAKSKRKP